MGLIISNNLVEVLEALEMYRALVGVTCLDFGSI